MRTSIERVAVVGSGVIGAGWAARCLANGLDVVATDLDPGAEPRLRAAVTNAWPALERVGLAPGASTDRLTFEPELEVAVGEAGFVQENVPEREPVKRAVLAAIDAVAAPDVVIASSTSGLLPTRIASDCQQPGRVVVGHPFNPVHLLPLVEVVGGESTDPAAVRAASEFYRSIGMRPLEVRNEIEGFLSDRLQEALWRENLHLVAKGVATTGELDAAIVYGPGLRWALMGVNLTFHLAGGEAGMRHMLEQFGPALQLPWTELEAPELTGELTERMVAGTEQQAGGRSVAELERRRDDFLVRLLELVEEYWPAHELGRADASVAVPPPTTGRGRGGPVDETSIGPYLPDYEDIVRAAWVDYNGHLSEAYYVLVFGFATDRFLDTIGMDEVYRRSAQRSLYTLEAHVAYLREVTEGEPLRVATTVLEHDAKRIHLFHEMYRGDGVQVATEELLLCCVDTDSGHSAALPTEVSNAVSAIVTAHRERPRDARIGRSIGLPGSR
jgi:carnitine 3-dehydrogenase